MLFFLCSAPLFIIIERMVTLWRRLARFFNYLLLTAFFLFVLTPQWPAFGDEAYRLQSIIGQRHFDFLVWEVNASLAKAESVLTNGHSYVNRQERKQTVLDYLDLIRAAQQLEAQINNIYVDPEIADPGAASRELQSELAQKRRTLRQLQPVAEAIIQDQVGTILVDEGFGLLGHAWPPVMMHMTPLPSLLVVSPRDRIERLHGFSLEHGLSTPAMEAMEAAIFDTLDRSALVVPIGGMGTYPAMIMEGANVNWLVEVTAHEWSHHWLGLYPLGLNYGDPRVRVINETVASLVDREIADQVIARYYPEFMVPAPVAEPPPAPATESDVVDAPPPFDFRAEMEETRIVVDALLVEGKIEQAEAYMEAQRRFFVANGYAIRKLNQAYFAFHGAYAAEPGATGADPIGPMLREIRAQSPTLRAFMAYVAPISSFEDLEELYEGVAIEK